MKNKRIIFMLPIFLILFGCISQNQLIDGEVHNIELIVYGYQVEPLYYSIHDQQLINEVIEEMNSIILDKDQIVEKIDLPKGISYQFNVEGEYSTSLTFVSGYIVYDHTVYKVNNESMIQHLKEKFGCDIE